MKPSPTVMFVIAAIGISASGAFLATRDAHGAADEAARVPSDATSFGFIIRSRTPSTNIPLLEATKPFSLSLGNGPVHGTSPDAQRLDRATMILNRELARYPASFLKHVRLAGIVLTEDLAEGDIPIPSFPNVGGLMLLDATSVESDFVRSLHHEVFHFFDVADDGQVAIDPSWDALNSKTFVYGSGGRTLRASWAGRTTDEFPGFVSAYATSATEEDKADTFAVAVARPAFMRERLPNDAILAKKVAELSRRLEAFDRETPGRLGFDAFRSLSL